MKDDLTSSLTPSKSLKQLSPSSQAAHHLLSRLPGRSSDFLISSEGSFNDLKSCKSILYAQ